MTKIIQRCYEVTGRTTFICDFSPPRSGDWGSIKEAEGLNADSISVAYNPGRAVRANSAMLAAAIKASFGKEVVFTLGTRDMNKLALQSQLLGAQLLGLENVVVVRGDPFSERDLALVKRVEDYKPTTLVAAIAGMNQGVDFRNARLAAGTDFCIGATVDLSRGIEQEAKLARRKVRSGAQFLITQPIFKADDAARFREAYASIPGPPLAQPVFFGLQLLEKDGIIFSSVPASVQEDLAKGRPGVEIAMQLYQEFQKNGMRNVYLVPPIRRGGSRNYAAARELLSAVS